MPQYQAPMRDIEFILNELLSIQDYSDLSGFDEINEELVSAVIDESAKFGRDVLAPLNSIGDQDALS